MGSFKVKLIKIFINNIDFSIETGTCFGNGTRQMARLSIESKGIMNKAFLGEDYSHLDLKNFRKNLGTEDYYYKDYASTKKYRRNLPRN